MKKAILALVLMLTSFPAYALSLEGVKEACKNSSWSQVCLEGLVIYRCAAYSWNPKRLQRCQRTARIAIREFDFKNIADRPDEWAAFSSELLSMLNWTSTRKYLLSLREQLEWGYQNQDRFSLWNHAKDFAKNYYGRDYHRRALRWIAVLFQDTSSSKAHLSYIEETSSSYSEETFILLSEILDLLEPSQLREENYQKWLDLYPYLYHAEQQYFKPSLYHFYTIAYLTNKIVRATQDHPAMAFFIPFLINASYEFKNIDPEGWPLRDPRPYSPLTHRSSVQDIYSGYRAGLWGMGYLRKPLLWKEFRTRLTRNPYQFMRFLYLHYQDE